MKTIRLAVFAALLASAAMAQTSHPQQKSSDWNFAVSGDSRNCGNVVVPSIAAGAAKNNAAFYWHLGDLRAIHGIDEDYQNTPEHRGKTIQKDLQRGILSDALAGGETITGVTLIKGHHVRLR